MKRFALRWTRDRQIEINELISKRGNVRWRLGEYEPQYLLSRNRERIRRITAPTKAKTQSIESAYQGAMDSKPGRCECRTKVAGSLERYAAAAQFVKNSGGRRGKPGRNQRKPTSIGCIR